MFDFAKATKNLSAVEILNYYRNLYYAEPQVTERGIVANAINDILPSMAEVVRCKDCKFYQTDHWCTRVALGIMYENDFCSYGERRVKA